MLCVLRLHPSNRHPPCPIPAPPLLHAAVAQAFREALAIKRRVLGPTHPAVGTSLNNIARALRYQVGLRCGEGEVPGGGGNSPD